MSELTKQINRAAYGPAGEHDHDWEPQFRFSRLAGTPHRRCTIEGCTWITLDSDECDCGNFADCRACRDWAEEQIANGYSPWDIGAPLNEDDKPLPEKTFCD